ncbi:MAG: DEAD/DEAH box helicase family protein [Deltaproteobacteria bacterium]|nr:DEAD/DEAH box helicase family protein [Deltaproteobacteria bacterium]
MATSWKLGMKLVHRAQPGWGVGAVLGSAEEGRFIKVLFAGRLDGPVVLSTRDPALAAYRFPPGSPVQIGAARAPAVILGEKGKNLDGYVKYEVETAGGSKVVDEREVFAPPPEAGPIAALKAGQWDSPDHFALRQEAVTLDLQRRGDALGALFASRVMVKPYQVSVVQRVLNARAPRFVLADEVGLGKTIEAGMVLSALSQSGLGRRLLVVAPGHLTLQWLAELYRKFNLRFTLLDGERLEAERKKDPTTSPFLRHDRILTSLELLARSDEAVDALTSLEGAPDMVVFDEAHHLAGAKAFAAAEKLAKASWGVLFLTATPLALDQEEYFHLLQLLEPSAARDPADFRNRLARSGEVAELSRAVLAGASEASALADALVARFPGDAKLKQLMDAWKKRPADRDRLLEHLAEGYTLSTRLLRNRRAAVGGFPKRVLERHAVKLSADEKKFIAEAQKAFRAGQEAGDVPTGAVGGALLRRIESSPAAAAQALTGVKHAPLAKLAQKARALEGPDRDARYRALRDLLREIPKDEKVLIFSEARETLTMLAAQLERDGFASAQYHGDLPAVERDRQVARFRHEDGPRVLLSSELGGEGRNFQFCRHLVHYDLPYSPAVVEQRIGRIDRVGQRRDMSIHVLEADGTTGARVTELFADAVGVFTQPVGGLDPVLDGVEEQVARLAAAGNEKDWDAYAKELRDRVELARAEIRENFDPLLDRRSLDKESVARLLVRGAERLGVIEDLPESLAERDESGPVDAGELEEGLTLLARELEERLEDVTVRLAQQAGIGVDTDEQVEAFEAAFTLGREMKIEALPGVVIPEDPETMLGSFWRDTAIEREEIEYYGSGHRLVEALIGLARDGQVGRSTFRKIPARERALGFQFRFLWELPEAADVAGGTRVPSRAAQRLLPRMSLDVVITAPDGGQPKLRKDLVEKLVDPDLEAEPMRREAVPLDKLVQPLEAALALATAEAKRALAEDVGQAKARLEQDREAAAARLQLRLARAEGAEKKGLEQEGAAEREFFDDIGEALDQLRTELDAAAGFLLS